MTTKTMIDRFVDTYGELPSPAERELLDQLTKADLGLIECIYANMGVPLDTDVHEDDLRAVMRQKLPADLSDAALDLALVLAGLAL
jgi:hypothetical protein